MHCVNKESHGRPFERSGWFAPAVRRATCAAIFTLVCLCTGNERILAADAGAANQSEDEPLSSGLDVGAEVPSFYSRVVTGPLRNRSVCYVCRYGRRPVVMVLLRKVGPDVRPLLRNIDRVVDHRRGSGVRSFGVLICDDPVKTAPSVQTFAFNGRIAMPLTVAAHAVAADGCQNVHLDAAATVVMFRNGRVEATRALREEDLTVENVRSVLKDVREFAGDVDAPAPP